MVSFSFLTLALTAAAGVLALPSHDAMVNDLAKRAITSPQTGTNNGYYYSFWTNGGGNAAYTNKAGGEYAVTWSNVGDFTCGKGWNPGSARYSPPSQQWIQCMCILTTQDNLVHGRLQPQRKRVPSRLRLDEESAGGVLHHGQLGQLQPRQQHAEAGQRDHRRRNV